MLVNLLLLLVKIQVFFSRACMLFYQNFCLFWVFDLGFVPQTFLGFYDFMVLSLIAFVLACTRVCCNFLVTVYIWTLCWWYNVYKITMYSVRIFLFLMFLMFLPYFLITTEICKYVYMYIFLILIWPCCINIC